MTPQPPPPAYPARSPWWMFRLLCAIGGICAFIAALCFCGITHGPAMAWLAGGVAAFFLAWSVP